jgi:hypothetical protein
MFDYVTGWTNALLRKHNNDALAAILTGNILRRPLDALHGRSNGAPDTSTDIFRMLAAPDGGLNSPASYLSARSNKRFLVNLSALSAKLRHRAACSFKKELSITPPAQLTHNSATNFWV